MRRNIPEQQELDIQIKTIKTILGVLKGNEIESPYQVNTDTKRILILMIDILLKQEERLEKLEREMDYIKACLKIFK